MTSARPVELSVLMPARNAAPFIEAAIKSVAEQCKLGWELIVVNDHSADSTRAICLHLAQRWPAIRLIDNPGRGKVAALNVAFEASRGGLVTTLDSDDRLPAAFWKYLASAEVTWDALCRDYLVVDHALKRMGVYHASRRFFDADFRRVLRGLISLPRACWTVRREIAEMIFPIPEDLPFEDVWFSLVIKRYATVIEQTRKPMYLYRQHPGQTYGGMLNYRPKLTMFRARRLAQYATILPRHAARLQTLVGTRIERTCTYFETLARPGLSAWTLFRTDLSLSEKMMIFCLRRFWPVLPVVKRLQWALSGLRGR